MIPLRARALLLAASVATAAACGSDAAEPGAAGEADTAGAAAPAAEEQPIGTLVGDIRSGIADLPALVTTAPDSARQRTVRLYVTRQEVIEARWGPRATEGEPDALAVAVAEAERRHHRLMEATGESPADPAAVAAAVDSLDAQLGAVLERARAVGIE